MELAFVAPKLKENYYLLKSFSEIDSSIVGVTAVARIARRVRLSVFNISHLSILRAMALYKLRVNGDDWWG